ncbi:MAG TPA: carboxypeptidase-like regulatory domain-containing protein, partial [Myxococcaceae bacterium]
PGVTVVVASGGVEARTGDNGRFRLEVEEGSRVRLEAHHSDLGFATTEVQAPALDVQLRLAPRASLDLQVLAQGAPVPGAVVTVRQRGGETAVFHADRTTDANGTMHFLGLPGGPLEVEALSPETGARSALQLEAREGAVAQVRLYLPVVGVVQGTVVTRSGKPVAGAVVGVEEVEGLPATSGKDGSFALKGLRTGQDYRLTARTPDLMLDTPVTARAGQTGVRLVVRDRPVYRGRVVGPGGTPLRSFSVDGRSFEAEDGRFAVPLDARDGQIEVRVGAAGMESRTVQAGATVSELGDIALQPAPELSGRVTLASGQPAADAEVTTGGDTTRTDASGSFVLPVREPPPAGSSLVVNAVKGDLTASVETSLPGPLQLVLSGEQSVRIRVLDPSGAPAARRAVQLSGARSYAWTTGEDGSVSGKALAGEYRVSTDAHPGRVWFVQLPAEGVVLGPASGSASLEVDVSAPLEALWIERGLAQAPTSGERPGPRTEGQLVFGVDSSVRFDGLAPGTWTVVGMRQGAPLVRTVQVSGSTRLSL